ncbi:MAG TPA: hypothetical protein EYP10_08330 [Armatimonadetes bacterium]|nr:hypothetical protein [Armatimonadota bacterium]
MRGIKLFFQIVALLVACSDAHPAEQPKDHTPFSFVQVTDTHIIAGKPVDVIKEGIEDIKRLKPEPKFVVVTGDLVDGEKGKEAVMLYKKLFSELRCPVYPVRGNHDWVWEHEWGKEILGERNYAFDIPPYHFIVLDNIDIQDETAKDTFGGIFPERTIAWLREHLKSVDKKTPIIIFCHATIYRPQSYSDKLPGDAYNYEAVLELLKPYKVVAWFAGHAHCNAHVRKDGVDYFTTGCLSDNRGNVGCPLGYRVVTVFKDRVETTYRPVRPTIVVAQDGSGDFNGKDERPIIEALEFAKAEGGGRILIKTGTYMLRRAIVLKSARYLAIVGEPGTILKVVDQCETVLTTDARPGDKELAVEDASQFVAGAKVEILAPPAKPTWKIRTVHRVAKGKLLLASPLDFRCPKGTRVVLAANVIELWGCHDITLTNLTLDGNKDQRTRVRDHCHQCGVHSSGLRNTHIINCTVKNTWYRGLSFYGPRGVLISACTLRNISDAAINFDHHSYWCVAIGNDIENCSGGVELNDTADCVVKGNKIRNCARFGVCIWRWHLTKGPDGKPGTFQNVRNKVLDNHIVAPGREAGIYADGAGLNEIIGNIIEGGQAAKHGILIKCPKNRIERNTVTGMSGYGIVIKGKGNILIGNNCEGNRAGAFNIEDPEVILWDNIPKVGVQNKR